MVGGGEPAAAEADARRAERGAATGGGAILKSFMRPLYISYVILRTKQTPGGDEQTARGQARRNQKAYEEEQLVAEALPAPALKPFMRHRVYFLSDPLE